MLFDSSQHASVKSALQMWGVNQWTHFSAAQSRQLRNMYSGLVSGWWLYKRQICWITECTVCDAVNTKLKSDWSSILTAVSTVVNRNSCCQRNCHENLLAFCFASVPLVYSFWLMCISFCFCPFACTSAEMLKCCCHSFPSVPVLCFVFWLLMTSFNTEECSINKALQPWHLLYILNEKWIIVH